MSGAKRAPLGFGPGVSRSAPVDAPVYSFSDLLPPLANRTRTPCCLGVSVTTTNPKTWGQG